MQEQSTVASQAESPKLVLAGKLVQLRKIKSSRRFTDDQIEATLKLLEEIISFGTPENGINSVGMVSELSYRIAYYVLLGVDEKTVKSYQPPKPYADELHLVIKEDNYDSIFETVVTELATLASPKQIESLMALLLKHQMYDAIIRLANASTIADKRAATRKFLLANMNVRGLLALLSKVSDVDDGEYEDIFKALLSCCKETKEGYLVSRHFLEGLARKSPLRQQTLQQVLSLFRNLCGGQHLATNYLAYGFRPLTVHLFHLLTAEEQEALLADPRLKLTSEEVGEIVTQKKEPTREYLERMSRAIHYTTALEQANPRRSEKLTKAFAVCYNANSWGHDAQWQFKELLGNPLAGLDTFHVIKSVPAMFALFEQFSLSETTKKMYFLQRPGVSVSTYTTARHSHVGNLSEVDSRNKVLFSLTEVTDPKSKLNKAEIPFIQACGTLASSMNAKEAEWLLQFLIDDKALHVRIPDLMGRPETVDDVLDGYLGPYLKVMLNPDADPELKKILLTFGGVMMERMNRDQLLLFLSSIYLIDMPALFMSCRDRGNKLQPHVVHELVTFFMSFIPEDEETKKVLFPAAFTHLCGRLVPAMTENQRRAVLSDPVNQISLPLVQTLVPASGPAPLELSPECLRILVLRSAAIDRPALAHLINVFEAQKNFDQITSMFMEYVQDPVNGNTLQDILLRFYFVHFLKHFVSLVNIFDPADIKTKKVLELIQLFLETPDNDVAIRALIVTVAWGCKGNADKSKYAHIAQHLFASPRLHDWLFKFKEAAQNTKAVVDTFEDLDHEILKPLFDFIFKHTDLKEPLVQLLKVFTGIRVVRLSTNNMNDNVYSHCFHEQNVEYLLRGASRNPAYVQEIRQLGPDLIRRCCMEFGSESARTVLTFYLDFGCRPSEADMKGDVTEFNTRNPFHLAAIQRDIPLLRLMLPYLERVEPVMLGMMIKVQTVTTEFSKEAFDLVFNAAREKDPNCFKNPKFASVYERFGFHPNAEFARPMLEAYLMMIEAGIKPALKELADAVYHVVKQDEEFTSKFERALEVHTPNSYLMYLIKVLKSDTAEEKAETAVKVQRIFREQGNKLDQGTLSDLLAWARTTQQPAEFIAEIEPKIVPVAPVPSATTAPQFFGGSNGASVAKTPLKKAMLYVRSPVSAAPQSLKSDIQAPVSPVSAAAAQPEVATPPQFFGGSNEAPRAKAPVKRAILGAASPVKAAAQPPVTPAPQFFGGGNVVPKKVAPAKRAVLASSSAVTASIAVQQDKSKISAKDDQSASALDSASLATQKGL